MSYLGFSFKPPRWLRDAVSGIKISVPPTTVPTPGGGTVTFNPASQQQLPDVTGAVQQIPGGWLTLGAAGVALYLLLSRRR